MRKVEEGMKAAVKGLRNWACGNTMVKVVGCVAHVYLFGNLIAVLNSELHGQVTLAEYDTHTTRSRLRALGVGVHRVNKMPYIDDTPINSNDWFNV